MGSSPCCGERKGKTEAQIKLLEQSLSSRTWTQPAQPMGAAGGTASFYALVPTDGADVGADWIGKDLERTFDELEFYELARPLRGMPGWSLLNHMIEYGGALRDFPVRWSDEDDSTNNLDLLVMRSLVEGYERPRLLDLKIGNKTASAGWRGKSGVAAWRQDMLDGMTNSAKENLRLEGFMAPPDWIETEDPLHDIGGKSQWSKKRIKKASRFAFQRMTAATVFAGFSDLRSATASLDSKDADQYLNAAEYAELVMIVVIRQLSSMLRGCGEMPVPQKWIGSSVAIATDAGSAPRRPLPDDPAASSGAPDAWLGPRARCCIFDWGRSELNTREKHEKLDEQEREDRSHFWASYQVGIGRVVWEAARLYWNSYCAVAWTSLHISLFDYDSQSQNDRLGSAEMTLPQVDGTPMTISLPLNNPQGEPVLGTDGKNSEVTIKVFFAHYHTPSRMEGAWHVVVLSAAHLRAADGVATSTTSDPFAVVALSEDSAASSAAAFSKSPGRRTQARTNVIPCSLNPTWNEELEFPIAKAAPMFQGAGDATAAVPSAGEAALRQALSCETQSDGDDSKRIESLGLALPPPHELGSKNAGGDDDAEQAPDVEREFLKKFLEQMCDKPVALP